MVEAERNLSPDEMVALSEPSDVVLKEIKAVFPKESFRGGERITTENGWEGAVYHFLSEEERRHGADLVVLHDPEKEILVFGFSQRVDDAVKQDVLTRIIQRHGELIYNQDDQSALDEGLAVSLFVWGNEKNMPKVADFKNILPIIYPDNFKTVAGMVFRRPVSGDCIKGDHLLRAAARSFVLGMGGERKSDR